MRVGITLLGVFFIGEALAEASRHVAAIVGSDRRYLSLDLVWDAIIGSWPIAMMPIVFGILLVAMAGPIAAAVSPRSRLETSVGASDLLVVGVILIGVYLFVSALSVFLTTFATFLALASVSDDPASGLMVGGAMANGARAIIGLTVALSAKRIVRWL